MTNGANVTSWSNEQATSPAGYMTAIQQLYISTGAVRTKLVCIMENTLVAALWKVVNQHPMLRARLVISNGNGQEQTS